MNIKQLVALHTHWCIADAIRFSINREKPLEDIYSKDIMAIADFHSRFMQIEVWYSLLYVVIEGYKALGIKCDFIDALLENEEMVSMLRRFRNATFHFQEDPISEKLLAFLEVPESEYWIQDLNAAFQGYFERELNISEVMSAILKGNLSN